MEIITLEPNNTFLLDLITGDIIYPWWLEKEEPQELVQIIEQKD